MDLYKKFKSFRPDRLDVVEVKHDAPLRTPQSNRGRTEFRRKVLRPRTDSEQVLLEELDSRWYSPSFDGIRDCLEAFPDNVDVIPRVLPFELEDEIDNGKVKDQGKNRFYLEERLAEYDRMRDLVHTELSAQVLKNYNEFILGMQKIQDINMDLTVTLVIVTSTRSMLSRVKADRINNHLETIQLARRRQRTKMVIAVLEKVQNALALQQRMNVALENLDFTDAVEALGLLKEALEELDGISCLESLRSSVKHGREVILTRLGKTLEVACLAMDSKSLERILRGYHLLEALDAAGDLMMQIFSHALDDVCEKVIRRHSFLGEAENDAQTNEFSVDFISLSSHINPATFIRCVFNILDAVTSVLYAFFKVRQIIDVEIAFPSEATKTSNESQEDQSQNLSSMALLQRELSNGRRSLWGRSQHRVAQMLQTTKLAYTDLKLTNVLRVLRACSQFREIGERFSGSDSKVLRGALEQTCRAYFAQLHRQSLDRLKLTIESDSWQPLPLQNDFGIRDVKTLRFEQYQYDRKIKSADNGGLTDGMLDGDTLFTMFAKGAQLFSYNDDDDEAEHLSLQSPSSLSPSSFDASSPVNKDAFSTSSEKAIVTTSALVLARFCGEYIAVIRSLEPIAEQAFESLTHLLYMYLYTVFSCFCFDAVFFATPSSTDHSLKLYYPNFIATARSIKQKLIQGKFCAGLVTTISESELTNLPTITSVDLPLHGADTWWGLIPRVAAAESLAGFLGDVVKWMDPVISVYVPKSFRVRLLEFATVFSQSSIELRRAIYDGICTRLLSPNLVLLKIKSCRWDLKELTTQHNSYVVELISMFEKFHAQLNQYIENAQENAFLAEPAISRRLWTSAFQKTLHRVVDAYASIEKCSTEGRAAMSLDLSVLSKGLERLTDIRPIPGIDYVDAYIKAYYLPSNDLVGWVSEHPEYTLEHHIGLANVGVAASMNKKNRNTFLQQIEQAYRHSSN